MTRALQATDLSLAAYDGRALLGGVSLRVEPGDALRLAGRSGLGKTTLLRALAALHPSTGALALGDQTPDSLGRPRWRRAVTLVPQRPRLFEGSVETDLRRSFGYASATSDFPVDRAAAMLESLDLPTDVLDRVGTTLSVGEQQRVCLVRGLLHRPSFALLDEPTSALDPESRDAVAELLQRARGEGTGLVLVSHDAFGLPDEARLDLEAFRA